MNNDDWYKNGKIYELINFFDKTAKLGRIDKEPKELWKKGIIYQNGDMNNAFRHFLAGYAYGITENRQ